MKNFKRRVIVMLLSLAMLVTYMPVFAFAAEDVQSEDQNVEQQAEETAEEAAEDVENETPAPEVSEPAKAPEANNETTTEAEPAEEKAEEAFPANAKFRMRVSSEAKGGVGSVTGTVYDGFGADLKFDGKSVNRSNATVEFWMQNVASLNVGKVRSYKQTIHTGLKGDDSSMNTVQGLFKPFQKKSTIKAIVNGKETTVYTVQMQQDGTVVATPDKSVGSVWHAIVNEKNIESGTKSDDDSYIVVKNGSWMQIGTQKLQFEKTDDLKLDDFNNVEGLNTAIRNAVKLADAEKADKIEIFLKPGTMLAMGNSYAKLKEEATITIDIAAFDEAQLENVLVQLKEAKNLSEMIKTGMSTLGTVFQQMAGKETVVNFNFGKQEEPVQKDDYKFRMKVASKDSTGAVGSVTGTVHEDFNADLKFEGKNVNRSNATVEFWMQNVASLGVSSERHYKQTVKTGLDNIDTGMNTVQGLFTPFQKKSTIKAVVNGKETTVYTVQMQKDGSVTATPDDNVRTVWHTIVNDKNIDAGTKKDDDSYIVIKNGSWMQIGTQKLDFAKTDDLKLDDFNNMKGLETAIRDAVKLADAEKADKIEIYLEPGTELAMGNSYAKLKDDAKITIDIADFDEAQLENVLVQLRDAKTLSDMIKTGLTALGTVFQQMGGKETVVTIDFGHKFGEPEWAWADDNKSATATFKCDNNPAHDVAEVVEAEVTEEPVDATCEEAGKVDYTAKVTFQGKEYTDKKTAKTDALGHKYGNPEWTWADDNKSATVTFTCDNDKTHTKSVEAKVTEDKTPATCEKAGKAVYTAKAEFEGKEYTETKEVVIDATGHDWNEPEWTWADDYTLATATRTCKNDPKHVQTEKAVKNDIKVVVSEEAGCEKPGVTTYTATVKFGDEEKSDVQVVSKPAPAGHTYGEPEWTWADDKSSATATFTCSKDKTHVVTAEAKSTVETTDATCEKAGKTVYTVKVTFNGKEYTDSKEDEIKATGHDWDEPVWAWADDKSSATVTRTCKNDESHVQTAEAKVSSEETKPATCDAEGEKTYTATAAFDGEETPVKDTQVEAIPALGHDWGEPKWDWTYDDNGKPVSATATFTCKNCGEEKKVDGKIENKDGDTYEAKAEGPDGKTYTDKISSGELLRIFGDTRYATAYKNADKLKEVLGVDKFEAVVVTTGENYPDALSGAYLAAQNDAPLLLINDKSAAATREYIQKNMKDGGKVMVLGGELAVKNSWLSGLRNVDRFAGATRYETNLMVLQAVEYTGGNILVSTGENYPDSLSGSALSMPILLVNGKGALSDSQKEYLGSLKSDANMYIAGGELAVTKSMEDSLKAYGSVAKRFAGATRYETSKLIAEEFFGSANMAVLSVGNNYPDGLSVGPLAAAIKAPILLANNDKAGDERSKSASEFTHSHGIVDGIIIGGTAEQYDLISDATAKKILSDKNIVLYEDGMYK